MSAARYPVSVRYRDLDPLGHVNNAVYLSYLELARVQWTARLGFRDPARPTYLVARVEVDFRRSILFGQAVEVEVSAGRVGTKSFTLAYRVLADGELAAEATTVQVWIDRDSGLSVPVPDEVRRRLTST